MGMVFRLWWCLGVLLALWAAMVAAFAWHAGRYTLEDTVRADAIVALTGGGGRVEYGLQLLAEGRGQALFISGVSKEVPLSDLLKKAPEITRLAVHTLSLGRITLGREATNTIGNAQESAVWVRDHQFHSVLLVTADYHMSRALAEFSEQLPQVSIIPAPVKTPGMQGFHWVRDAELRNLVLSEFHKLMAARMRHWLIAL